jgi:hypothetical protein
MAGARGMRINGIDDAVGIYSLGGPCRMACRLPPSRCTPKPGGVRLEPQRGGFTVARGKPRFAAPSRASSQALDACAVSHQNRHQIRCLLRPWRNHRNALRGRFPGGRPTGYPIMTDATKKPFRLRADQIRPIVIGYGGCIATEMITEY